MYASNASFKLILIQLQGSYILSVLVGQLDVSGRSLLSRSFARHLRGMRHYATFNGVGTD